ncbi:MAG TPA: hypothetical protein VKT80_10760, partial [Chloroflexota bacterium]|nr:hypothetical protein [Chloroflexota bacterium]
QYVLSVWTPPASMKTNNSTQGYVGTDTSNLNDSTKIGYLAHASYSAFVAFLTKAMKSLNSSTAGAPAYLSVQNEPTNLVNYDGCLYRNHVNPVFWDSVLAAARGSFDFIGLDTSKVKLYGPETSTYSGVSAFFGGSGFPWITSNFQGTNKAVSSYAFHTYYQGDKSVIDSTLLGMQDNSARDSWVTEYSNLSDSTPLGYVLSTFSDMGAALVIVPNNYWAWFNGWAAKSTEDKGTLITGTTTNPLFSKRYHMLRKVWTSIAPNKWRVQPMSQSSDPNLHIGITGQEQSSNPRVDLWAFQRTDDSLTVVMLVNHTTTDKAVTIGGFPTWYNAQHSWRTDATNDVVAQQATNVFHGFSTVSLPAQSFVFAVMQKL